MPFIRRRYHINPVLGQAIEAAREAEAARLAAADDQQSQNDGQDNGGDGYENDAAASAQQGPIHRVEIDAAELVPSHSGRAQRGFVARVHRQSDGDSAATPRRGGYLPGAHSETHVFAGHQDLLDFLQHELAKDCAAK
jgi:hypothetical protein